MTNVYSIKIECGKQLTFPVRLKSGRKRYITFEVQFGDKLGRLYTDSPVIQEAIENDARFTSGKIQLLSSVGPKEAVKPPVQYTDFPEITDINSAREFLKAEPYNVLAQSLRTPESILKKAEEKGVNFPNLVTLDE
jgi:hypothetical protein